MQQIKQLKAYTGLEKLVKKELIALGIPDLMTAFEVLLEKRDTKTPLTADLYDKHGLEIYYFFSDFLLSFGKEFVYSELGLDDNDPLFLGDDNKERLVQFAFYEAAYYMAGRNGY